MPSMPFHFGHIIAKRPMLDGPLDDLALAAKRTELSKDLQR